jgi:hypothetical protein
MRPSGAVRILSSLAFAALIFTTACNDDFGPSDWVAVPDTVDLFSMSRDEYQGLPAAFDLLGNGHGQDMVVEYPGASGNWDFALKEMDGRLVLIPAGVLRDLEGGAGIAPLPNETFETLDKIPGDPALYQDSTAVTLEAGRVYAVRSRRYYAFGGQSCSRYGKLSPVSIDDEEGILRFEIVRNPNCNDRSMIPPKSKK